MARGTNEDDTYTGGREETAMTMAVKRRDVVAAVGVAIAALALVAALVGASGPSAAQASSHREAPVISDDPAADNTDVYAFVSPNRPDSVTMIANYIPLEEPAGGPNFAKFADSVLYAIHVDNDGDGREDVTYEFRFKTQVLNGNTFLYNTGPITSLTDPDWNVRQTYSVRRVDGKGKAELLGRNIPTPPVNIGPRSTPDYDSLASAAVTDLPGGIKVFAGQRDDPFFVDLGSVFDLAGLRPFNPFHIIPLPGEDGVDGVAGFNTHSIVIQVPTAQLATFSKPTIGIYASASRQKVTILRKDGTRKGEGAWIQVSRLANPLVNEVVIPLGKKDLWNGSDPQDDGQFEGFYTDPEVTRLENALYPVLDDAPDTGRGDLVAVLLTGVPTLNFTGDTKSDLIRLNTSIPPDAQVGAGNRLGLLGGDFSGFPNGRRLEDDVTDIELRAFACGYGPIVAPIIEGFGFCGGNANRTPNNQLGDGVDENEKSFMTTFPYVASPHQGYQHTHHGS
jgi:Domain of unknown function (DUF4331)